MTTPLSLIGDPPAWRNQNVALFHGTSDTHRASLGRGITIQPPFQLRSNTKDFGVGFYTTTSVVQAMAWSHVATSRFGGTELVIVFDVPRDQLAALDGLWFVRGSERVEDFWSLVWHCRNGGTSHGRTRNGGWYDVVAGPVAGKWKYRKLKHQDYDQVSFHTPKTLSVLNSIGFKVVL